MPIETHEQHLKVMKDYISLLNEALDEVTNAQETMLRIYDCDTFMRACVIDATQCARMAIISMITSYEDQLNEKDSALQ